MRYQPLFAALLVLVCITTSIKAGQFNRVLDIGSQAPSWDGLEGIDGNRHSYEEVASAKFVVVAFTCNSCPYAVDAEDRLIALSKQVKERGGALVAINANTIESDLLPAMRQRAKEKGFEFDYLHDSTQEIAKKFGATTTPEFYVLGPDRKVVYMGTLDDSPDGRSISKRYVEDAIDAVVGSEKLEVTETAPIGCRIRAARVRRKQRQ